MTIEEERAKFEEEYKWTLYKKIGEYISYLTNKIVEVEKYANYLGQGNIEIPNIGVIVNNKLGEYEQKLKEAGISMYADICSFQGLKLVEIPFVAQALIDDLLDIIEEADKKMGNYRKLMAEVAKNKTKSFKYSQNFFSKIKAFFSETSLLASGEDIEKLNEMLENYTNFCDEIWKSSLKDRLVPGLVKKIAGPRKVMDYTVGHNYSAIAVPHLLKNKVIPELKKLGYDNLIPQIKDALIAEYSKDALDPEIKRWGGVIIPNFNEGYSRDDFDEEEYR